MESLSARSASISIQEVRFHFEGRRKNKIACCRENPGSERFSRSISQNMAGYVESLGLTPSPLLDFTSEEGADLPCEPNAAGLRDPRIFDWSDEQFNQ